MPYSVHLTILMDDGSEVFDRVLDNHDDIEEALDHAEAVCTAEADRTGIVPMPVEDATDESVCPRCGYLGVGLGMACPDCGWTEAEK